MCLFQWIKRAPTLGLDDKHQITVVFAVTMAGDFFHLNLSIKAQPVHVCQPINFQIPGISLALCNENSVHK